MWDQRYATEEYIYGKEPNAFFRDELSKLQAGKILLPAEGEGRNAVYAALMGWQVTAFDSSIEGRKKAVKLAQDQGVEITYDLLSHTEAHYEENSFDLLALIYAHTMNWHDVYQNFVCFLKPGGHLVLEGFSLSQLANNSGGPSNPDLLFTEEGLAKEFSQFSELNVREMDILLEEGRYHTGKASVIRVSGVK